MIRISACVIARNEEENIPRWLESVKSIADEMIVVDTGSTDATVAIAESYGARILHYTWNDDFAAAKNVALDAAQGEWILFLDADEYFTARSIPKVRPLIEKFHPQLQVIGLVCRLINVDKDADNKLISNILQVRIFRNQRRLRYEGKVHECLSFPKNKKLEMVRELEIYHTGYSSSIMQAKFKRNLALLDARVAAGDKVPMDDKYYMDIWNGLGDYEKAIGYAKKLLAVPNLFFHVKANCYESMISCMMKAKRPYEEVEAAFQAARKECPQLAEFSLMWGIWRYQEKDYLQAQPALEQGVRMAKETQENQKNLEMMMDNAEKMLPDAYARLANIYDLKRSYEKAQEYYCQSLHTYPYQSAVLQSFFLFLQKRSLSDADCIALLNSLYEEQDAEFLTKNLAGIGGRVCLYYAKKAGIEFDASFTYLMADRPEAAALSAAELLTDIQRLALYAVAGGKADPQEIVSILPCRMEPVQQEAMQMRMKWDEAAERGK